ncbi:single-stranded DNA-binding protein [Candidatus Phytoplasma meliae]|uniref:Single-stranded DNA-binding protein n=1 Tax=Candidatus Phytoplasma meliae TaxID=1848402 RepID=A0ABS5CXR0_9MOLU|nr:single-stranded DNA-binding protein [Candidatus Phytoplasma meliae]MBP5835765.1 single-stranded DNA-binding protein [Candidatus Phytoplasma meliae]
MINKVILVGRITKIPELKFHNGDIGYVKFTLAVNRNFGTSDEEKKTDFINCIVWRKQAENLNRYVSKGALLGIEGSIRVEKWEKDGRTNWSTEVSCSNIHFLEPKKRSENEYDSHETSYREHTQQNQPTDDSAPF